MHGGGTCHISCQQDRLYEDVIETASKVAQQTLLVQDKRSRDQNADKKDSDCRDLA